jgi:hypothetical protein
VYISEHISVLPSGKGELQRNLSGCEGNWLKVEDFKRAAEESSWAVAECLQ